MSDTLISIGDLNEETRNLEGPSASSSKSQKVMKIIAWGLFSVFCLSFFTLIKIPQAKVKSLIHGNIVYYLGAQGIDYTSGDSEFSTLLGFRYTVKQARIIKNTAPDFPIVINSLSVNPSLLGLLTGKIGASVSIQEDPGSLTSSFSTRGPNLSVQFQSQSLNLAKIGAFGFLTGLKGAAILSGEGEFSGDLNAPNTVNGALRLNLSKITLEEQAIQGFAIPRISISEANVDLRVVQGKVSVSGIKFGKPGGTDDLAGNIAGDGQLGRPLDATHLNLKAKFTLSQNILKAIPLLDAILGSAKQKDGSYAYNLQGNLNYLTPTPIPAQ